MSRLIDQVRSRPLAAFYALAFGVSWGLFLALMLGPGTIPGRSGDMIRLMPRAVMALLAGPFIAGLLMTGAVQGKAGFCDLLRRFGIRRSDLGFSAVCLLAVPPAMLVLPLAAAAIWPQFLPRILTETHKAPLLAMAVGAGLSAGFFEETGWTGFAAPLFLRRRGVLSAGLAMGALWGAWHLIVNLWSSGDACGRLALGPLSHSLAFSFAVLPAFRVVMFRIYDRTRSLSLAMLMHFGLTAGNVIFIPADCSGPVGPVWPLLVALPLWAAAALPGRVRPAPSTGKESP